jgi:D-arabinose 1-dehydrogenase-like Zn-dependent alcohol dehydrogenase
MYLPEHFVEPRIDLLHQFSMKHRITPAIELYPMKEVNGALEHLRENRLRYRAVLVNEN